MSTNTYVALQTQVLGSASSITFTSIPQTYTDLEIVLSGASTNSSYGLKVRINGDTGTNYSSTLIEGQGSSAFSYRYTNNTAFDAMNYQAGLPTDGFMLISRFFNYANSTTYKTVLSRYTAAAYETTFSANLWRGTTGSAVNQPITSISLIASGNLATGTTATIYGIQAA